MGSSKQFAVVSVGSILISQTLAYFASPRTSILSEQAFLSILIQWLVFLPSSGMFGHEPTERFYDFTGASTYIIVILRSLLKSNSINTSSWRQIIASTFVLLWSLRLGSFLFTRITQEKGIDSRFAKIKTDKYRFAVAWTLQGLCISLFTLYSFYVIYACSAMEFILYMTAIYLYIL